MATIKFYTLLRLKLGIQEIEIEADNVPLKEVISRTKEILGSDLVIKKVLNDDGSLRRGTNILVNGQNILSLEKMETIIKKEDVIGLFPFGGGG